MCIICFETIEFRLNSLFHFRKIVRLIALCFLATGVIGCKDKLQLASEYATIAEQQFTNGDAEAAKINIQKAIATRDDVAAYYALLGQIEIQAQQPVRAFNAFSLALDLEADNVQILQAIADLGLQTGRTKEAKEAAERILILDPGSTNALLVKGFIALDEGQFSTASQTVADILALNAQDEGGIILSARIDALQGRSQEALKKIETTISEIGETSALNATRLEIYRLLGESSQMLSTLPSILKNVDTNSEYQLDYINVLYKVGRPNEARAAGLSLLLDQQTSKDQISKLLGIWAEYDADPLTQSQLPSFADSDVRETQIILARYFLLSNKLEFSRILIESSLKKGKVDALALSARIMLAEGKSQIAFDLASRILVRDPRNEDALIVRSQKLLAEKKYSKSIADASIVVSDAPQNPIGYVQLANAFAAKGNTIRARQIFEEGMDALPQSRLLAGHYKKLLHAWGDRSRIVSLDKEVALATPSSTKSWIIYSDSCSRFGDKLCAMVAKEGLAKARTSFLVDDLPGTPRRRGLFARITPEKICATTGGICTEN